MLLFVMTGNSEAKPLIKSWRLKKDPAVRRMEYYSGDNARLIISGKGIVRTSAAAAFLLGKNNYRDTDILIHIGFCFAVNTDFAPGTPVICNKIINESSGKSFYPDIIFKHELNESSISSYSFFKGIDADEIKEAGLFDSEAAGFIESALAFLPPHRVLCIKFIIPAEEYNSKSVNRLGNKYIYYNHPLIEKLILAAQTYFTEKPIAIPDDEIEFLEQIFVRLRLTETMKHRLMELAEHYIFKHQCGLDVLKPYLLIEPESKQKRNSIFNSIVDILSEG